PTRVIYNGVRDLSHDPQEALPGLQGQAFLLHISRLAPSKNVELLLQLAALWPQRQFVLAGGDSPYARTVQDSLISRQLHNVRLFLDVSDAQKAWLYAHCNAFLFPSMAEGFGLPPIEAMHFGKPVFLSRLTSLPEIGGAVATYWDDLAPAAMRAVLETSDLTPVPARQALIAAHARQFNWPSCVGAYLSCYRQWLKLPESAV
ncbi:MAG: glycosyltransferase, partial [Pseudomonadota bacterium]